MKGSLPHGEKSFDYQKTILYFLTIPTDGSVVKSVQDQVLALIKTKAGRGRRVHVPRDFLDLGSRDAVDQALSRLARAGVVRRLLRGVYDFPKRHPRLGTLAPNLDDVAKAIARSTGCHIQLSGSHAANSLGLSTQVPARLVYLTNGSSRTVRIGNQTIQFRHATPRTLAAAGSTAGTVIQALRHLGPDDVTSDTIDRIRTKLTRRDLAELEEYVRIVPSWLKPTLSELAQAT